MNKSIPLRTYVASALLCLTLFASCSADDDTALPEGKYPMTFATAMEGLTQTRATTDNTWTGNEEIAVQVGSEVKEYKPTASSAEATLTGVDAANTFYWQTASETKNVSAWYSGAEYTAQLSSFSVKTDQSTDVGYRQSDFLYAKPQDISFSRRNSTTLTFEHLPAKVVVHLKYGDGLTADKVAGATVRIVSQATTSGAINAADGTVEQATPVSAEIIPGTVTPKAGYQQSVQALLVPQQMQDYKFIKVTIGTGDDARNYYYTPTAATDANLENGKQYTYEVTVTKTGLSVASVTIGRWTDIPKESGKVDKAIFRVKLTGGPLLTDPTTLDGIIKTATDNVYETTGGSSFSFSYTTSNLAEVPAFTIEKGMATETRTEIRNNGGTTTYTYTCTNIRSDLWINHLAVGYYYYADGTWSSEYTAGEPACIGIVFWVGDATKKDATLKNDHPDCTHGLVVALNYAEEEGIVWQNLPFSESSSFVQRWLDNNQSGVYLPVNYVNHDNIQGYNNTKAIEKFNAANSGKIVEAVVKVAEYRNVVSAPANSSDWYLPSIKELTFWSAYFGWDLDLINNKLGSINSVATPILRSDDHWSSTEIDYNQAEVLSRSGFMMDMYYKHAICRVRCVLAF